MIKDLFENNFEYDEFSHFKITLKRVLNLILVSRVIGLNLFPYISLCIKIHDNESNRIFQHQNCSTISSIHVHYNLHLNCLKFPITIYIMNI